MSKFVSVLRLVAVLLGCVAVIATVTDTATRAKINPFNFFGFFTMQSNIIWYVVMAVTAVVVLTGRKQSATLQLARGCATAYMILVGAIYNTLLAGQEGGVALAWANSVVHIALPLYAVLDWVLFNDRRPLAWKRLWVSLIYPMVWVVVVLIRGATDGWVPYPFFQPGHRLRPGVRLRSGDRSPHCRHGSDSLGAQSPPAHQGRSLRSCEHRPLVDHKP